MQSENTKYRCWFTERPSLVTVEQYEVEIYNKGRPETKMRCNFDKQGTPDLPGPLAAKFHTGVFPFDSIFVPRVFKSPINPHLCFRSAAEEADRGQLKVEEEWLEMKEAQEMKEMKEMKEMTPRPLKEKPESEKGEDRRRLANSDPVAFEELYKVSVVVVVVVVDGVVVDAVAMHF